MLVRPIIGFNKVLFGALVNVAATVVEDVVGFAHTLVLFLIQSVEAAFENASFVILASFFVRGSTRWPLSS